MSELTTNATNSASLASSSEREGLSGQEWSLLLGDVKRLEISDLNKVADFRLKWDQAFQGEPMNLLHRLVTSELRDLPYSQLNFFIKMLLEAQPEHLEWPEGDEDYTPLHVALQAENHLFSKAFLDVCKPATMNSILQKTTTLFPTLLHQAIWIQSPFVAQILTFCSAGHSIFSVQDRYGRTPLHLAVALVDEQDVPVKRRHNGASATYPTTGAKPASDSTLPRRLPVYSPYDTVRHLIARYPKALLLEDSNQHTPYQRRLWWLQYCEDELVGFSGSSIPHDKEDQNPNMSKVFEDDAVISYIRAYSIRNFTTSDTMSMLYRPGQGRINFEPELPLSARLTSILERHIEFVLSEFTETLSGRYLEQLGQHLLFERVLKQVVLPNLKFESSQLASYGAIRRPTHPDQCRRDAFRIFAWLRKSGVQKIIKVTVDDSEESYHSDETIVNALEGFEVETLDWKRNDIPSSVIANSSSVIKDLRLYFTGKASVIKDWCGNGGFRNEDLFSESQGERLELMKYVESFKSTMQSETNGRVRVYYIDEKEDMNRESEVKDIEGQLQPSVTSRIFDQMLSQVKLTSSRVNASLNSMVNFAKLLRTAPSAQNIRPVKIAIIDNGIDASLIRLRGKIAAGMSFYSSNSSTDAMSPYFVPSGKSGTVMAMLICEICPQVSLYIAKVDQHAIRNAQSTAKAIRWAMDCNVDIISVSCIPEDTSDIFQKVIDSINDTSFWREACIIIDVPSNKTWTKRWDYREVDFLLPGQNVPLVNNTGQIISYESGRPVATAIASGLAGLLIFCSWLLDENDVLMKHPKHMRRAFKSMSPEDSQFPLATDLFDWLLKLALAQTEGVDHNLEQLNNSSTVIWNDHCREELQRVMRLLRYGGWKRKKIATRVVIVPLQINKNWLADRVKRNLNSGFIADMDSVAEMVFAYDTRLVILNNANNAITPGFQ
ncbi:intracellular serine protease [Fusarium mundagurra]|uniref:Intracellular serine protease n=1 Tax=Fusarium mundagurra TaxID=1567541 RepID=A0A8H5XV27_9HYPO|nr:intracellular serine protease [Fusarium mundagurra]